MSFQESKLSLEAHTPKIVLVSKVLYYRPAKLPSEMTFHIRQCKKKKHTKNVADTSKMPFNGASGWDGQVCKEGLYAARIA